MLKKRCLVHIDDDYQIPVDSERLVFDLSVHHLDYLLTVSNSIGLWAAIPAIAADHNFTVTLDLKKPYRDFKGKYGKLGFDPAERILYCGRAVNGDDIFIGMCPIDLIEGREEPTGAGFATGDTRMSTARYRILVMLFALALKGIENYDCWDAYGISLDQGPANFDDYTNIM